MKYLLIIAFFIFSLELSGQSEKYQITDEDYSNNKVEMADDMRASGKIYVVVGVILLIFIGMTVYLYSVDRRVSKMESAFEERVNKETET